jgi:hypothetical protein
VLEPDSLFLVLVLGLVASFHALVPTFRVGLLLITLWLARALVIAAILPIVHLRVLRSFRVLGTEDGASPVPRLLHRTFCASLRAKLARAWIGAMAAATKRELERRQRRWAEHAGIELDAAGFVRDEAMNLRAPLSAVAQLGFARGSERAARSTLPPRMRALHSSAALVANVFDYWTERDAAPLAAALGLAPLPATLSFEEPLPTGLEGDPPTADVLVRFPSGYAVAIESKFTEWLVRRPRNKAVLKTKYFPPGDEVWARRGLPRCQRLAERLQGGAERYRFLHAAQLLKHALGLAMAAPRAFELRYLYYDWPAREAAEHRAEIERFAAAVAPELAFRATTYQSLVAALALDRSVERAYLDYLCARYFPELARR